MSMNFKPESIVVRDNGTRSLKMICEKNSHVKDSQRKSCDINEIMRKYERNGRLPDMIKQNPIYGDFSNVLDYRQSIEVVNRANEQFNALPAQIRARFMNNPEKFLDFCNNPENKAEMIKMGLMEKEETEEQPKIVEPAKA